MSNERSIARGTIEELLRHSVWSYVFALIQNGDGTLLRKIGIGAEHLRRLSALSIQDLQRAIQSGDEVVQVRIDADRLEEVMLLLERGRVREQLLERCIRLGAPWPMMKTFFAMKHRDFRDLQARYDVHSPAGRPPHPSPEVAERIYRNWEEAGRRMTAAGLVRVAEETGLPLHVVWREVSYHPEWETVASAPCMKPSPTVVEA
jgi:hypothetical protein